MKFEKAIKSQNDNLELYHGKKGKKIKKPVNPGLTDKSGTAAAPK